jgi:hypothetical protein
VMACGLRMRRRALPDGLLNGLGRVVAWGCLKRCGLRPGDGPNCLRESGHMVTFGLDNASRGSTPNPIGPERVPSWIAGVWDWIRVRETSWNE